MKIFTYSELNTTGIPYYGILAVLGIIDSFRFPIPNEAKKYPRFQRDRFGVVVRCSTDKLNEFQEIMKNNGAEEVHVEKD